jgi:hypothetical protein
VAFGLDLEWETEGAVFRYPAGRDRYEVPCRVHGEVLVGHEVIELDAVGQRDHSWGVCDWWSRAWCRAAFRMDDGSRWHAEVAEGPPRSIGYVQPADAPPEEVTHVMARPVLGRDGIPTAVSLTIGTTSFTVDPVAWAPVLLTAPDAARRSRLPRALARVRDQHGTEGVGWIELNQPEDPGGR